MNDHGLPANEELRQALDGVAGIFEAQLRRCDEYGTEIEATRARYQAESDRLAAIERTLAADRAALQQMGSVFAEVARRSDPAAAPAAAPAPPAVAERPIAQPTVNEQEFAPEIEQEHALQPVFSVPLGAPAATAAPALLVAEPTLAASAPQTVPAGLPLEGRFSSLSAADLMAASSRGPKRDEFAD